MKSEDIRKRQRTKNKRGALRRVSQRQATEDESCIHFEDIPPLTGAQLSGMVRLRSVTKKAPVSLRLDPGVLSWLKSKGKGHLTRIKDILTNLMEAEQQTGPER